MQTFKITLCIANKIMAHFLMEIQMFALFSPCHAMPSEKLSEKNTFLKSLMYFYQ